MNQSLLELKKVGEEICQAGRILVICHVAPDGDAIGSLLGLGWLLRDRGKSVTLACEDPVPEAFTWLPGSDEVVQQGEGRHDLVISLDCSDERRLGEVYDESLAPLPLINIDHHVTNTFFGTVNWVEPSAVATAQMILALAEGLDWELTERIAVCLLTGLVTDTRSFRTSNVDSAVFEAAMRLIEAGASLGEIIQRVLEQRPLATVRLWGDAITALQARDGVLWTAVTRAMRQRWGVGEEGSSGLASFLSGVRESNIVAVFTERDKGVIDVSMRAAPGYDVAAVALRLGGGGHPRAAGCTLETDLSQAKERVLAEIERYLSGNVVSDDVGKAHVTTH